MPPAIEPPHPAAESAPRSANERRGTSSPSRIAAWSAIRCCQYEAEKPTAAVCHGVSALIDRRLADGSSLIEGKTITGFANVEEDFADQVVGKQVMPSRDAQGRCPFRAHTR